MIATLDDIVALYARHGHRSYGEGVSQLEHAVQCAMLAEAEGAPPSLVVAALLHDVGHLVEDGESAADARHEMVGAAILARVFGAAVVRPCALHVQAKRYLCATEPGYAAALSPASQRSLVLQGGAFDSAASVAFAQRPYAGEAIALRRFDDSGKRVDAGVGRRFADYLPMLSKVAAR
ncbi:HD domain-containing protein [Polymorphobacter sp. PAMC 29334]|uniref:HD domain-containing protein n=1 Tax=Polymorphobacter sp. PAMC 29334 TaxID=2862331 RepID=UPI001C76D63A|nr:HD domain-containing protein [Polymorphobacter sp. PAMC 29334]QYE35776.1 HD domain-containing protein [Polymorphobacter sp. PAMC 29334]